MHYSTTLAVALAASTSALNILPRQDRTSDFDINNYLTEVCMPTNASGSPDLNAPCTALQLITAECVYGPAGLQQVLGNNDPEGTYGFENNAPTLSNSSQRTCVCESQFYSQALGCNECYKAHGAPPSGINGYLSEDFLSSASSSYCAVTNTPTVGFAEVLYAYATGSYASSIVAAASTASSTSTFSDPLGNRTAVSLYFTPSVTGSAAWVVAEATESASAMSASGSGSVLSLSQSTMTSDGQIVATADATQTGSASGTASGASSTASTTDSAAGRQEVAAIAGVIAMAGFVAVM